MQYMLDKRLGYQTTLWVVREQLRQLGVLVEKCQVAVERDPDVGDREDFFAMVEVFEDCGEKLEELLRMVGSKEIEGRGVEWIGGLARWYS